MFERFTDRARRVVVRAQDEARTLDHDQIGTEHLLLGLTHETIGGVAARVLESLGIGPDFVGTEHILLGLIAEREGVAAQVLSELGADLDRAREQVLRLLYEYRRTHGNQTG